MSTKMMDAPPSLQPPGYFPGRGRLPRSISDSPTRQRTTDDLLSNLSPTSALAAFRNPSGALKECMDAATPTEQSFAIRTAVASQKIGTWLEELANWPWPAGGSSSPFEFPAAKRRKQPRPDGSAPAPEADIPALQLYMGSFLAADVSLYLERVDEISREMEQMDLEEIKSHVLYNHIMPLSRPGTPLSDAGRPMVSISSYNKMDDLTALITATIVQALPNLYKLNRLMNAWATRLAVLKKAPSFMSSLEDVESALTAARNTIDPTRPATPGQELHPSALEVDLSVFTRKELDIMKSILDAKVSRAGRHLDSMLDMLEGSQDTLPEHWIDRMDSLEQRYVEWLTHAERAVRETEWAEIAQVKAAADTTTRALKTLDGLDDTEDGPIGAIDARDEIEPSLLIEESVEDVSELDLPPLPSARRGSNSSANSTIIHGSQMADFILSSDPPDHGTPDLHRYRDATSREATPADERHPSSPPPSAFRSSTRSVSVSFVDMPTVTELPDDESPPRTPAPYSQEPASPAKPGLSRTDDQLQQQISEILESLPAKIRLTTQPPAINLNPPDFKMPIRAKPSKPDKALVAIRVCQQHPREQGRLRSCSRQHFPVPRRGNGTETATARLRCITYPGPMGRPRSGC